MSLSNNRGRQLSFPVVCHAVKGTVRGRQSLSDRTKDRTEDRDRKGPGGIGLSVASDYGVHRTAPALGRRRGDASFSPTPPPAGDRPAPARSPF